MNKPVYINQLWAAANGRVTKHVLQTSARMSSQALRASSPSHAPYCHVGKLLSHG